MEIKCTGVAMATGLEVIISEFVYFESLLGTTSSGDGEDDNGLLKLLVLQIGKMVILSMLVDRWRRV